MTEEKRFSGLDSLVVSHRGIARRSSMVTSIVGFEDNGLPDLDAPIEVPDFDEADLLLRSLEREPSAQYQLLNERTEGGMGKIFNAYDSTFRRPVAMKVIQPRLRNHFSAFEAFIREARITAQLEHPNIVPVHDMGYLDEQGSFFTMKLVEGEPLIDILHRLEFEDPAYLERYDAYALLAIFRKICDAVAFAHSRGIIHRDIKPHNVMVGEYGEVLLMDWGLARVLDSAEPDFLEAELQRTHGESGGDNATTATGVVKGSPSYMSPEQALGDPALIDEQSDVFLLGATLYHLFTFYPPYLGDDIYEIINAARDGDYPHPAQLATAKTPISKELAHVINRAMAPDKAERYASVNELGRDVDRLLRGEISNPLTRSFAPGQTLLVEGEIGKEAYIIRSGSVQVTKSGDNGQERVICTLHPGDVVGEMALITHEPRSATVTALEPTVVIVLDAGQYGRSTELLPPWMNQILTALASRLREATGHYA